jgi:hypothetical protein
LRASLSITSTIQPIPADRSNDPSPFRGGFESLWYEIQTRFGASAGTFG